MTKEWEFKEESEDVDLERLHTEINSIPAIYSMAYMEQLKIKAPVVYQRYMEWKRLKDK